MGCKQFHLGTWGYSGYQNCLSQGNYVFKDCTKGNVRVQLGVKVAEYGNTEATLKGLGSRTTC